MRVIAGSARGRRLLEPPDKSIRPTLDKVRTALFNMLMPELEDAQFLDLFSGTGANGIEALSRGAAQCVFVDSSPESQRIIRENLFHTGTAQRARCLAYSLPKELGRLTDRFDIVFADPPYDCGFHAALLEGLEEHRLVKRDGVVVIEHSKRQAMPEAVGELELVKTRHYGEAALSVYRHAEGREA